jgi:hypothetical protein
MEEWQLHLKPYLLSKTNNQWLQPDKFNNLKEFHKAYVEEYAKALAAKTLVDEIDNADEMIIEIKKQLELPDKSYGI